MDIENKDLKRRLLEISYKNKLSHLGSCLTAVDIIKEIYDTKRSNERFILSSGHAGLALYVVIESFGGRNAEEIFLTHGVHPDKCIDCGLDCSTGSLSMGISIATGLALANRNRKVYTLCSDGEAAEGLFWESLRIASELNLSNLEIHLNANGWGAFRSINIDDLEQKIKSFKFPVIIHRTDMHGYPDWLQGQQAHYISMDNDKYKEILGLLR